jgi:dUTP pyrophosphatase
MEFISVEDKNLLTSIHDNIAILKIACNNDELLNIYSNRIKDHNSKISTNKYADSGFDLLVPNNELFTEMYNTKFINFQLKCEMLHVNLKTNDINSSPFYIYPRSSISKTPLMLSNHTGIIDSGYRGDLIGAFRSFSDKTYNVEKHTRLLQICHSSLCPIYIVVVNENMLTLTERGNGGFGSTGK